MDLFQAVCRICECDKNLFDLTSQANVDTAEMLATLTSIRIQADDPLPKCLCDECSSTLKGFHEYLQRCKAAEQRWQDKMLSFVKQERVDTAEDQESQYGMISSTHTAEERLAENEMHVMEDQKDIVFEDTKIAERIPMDENRNEKFFCRTCGKCFEKVTELNHHAESHAKRLPWRSHLQNYVPGEQNFPCQSCQNSYKTSSGLTNHVISVHMGEKPFTCTLCGKAFSQKGNLEEHRTTHAQERNYPCEICTKRFKSKRKLKKHMDQHLPPVECDICHGLFSTKETLRSHRLLHTRKRSYQCNVCTKTFILRKRLTAHMKQTHGDSATALGQS